MVTAALASRLFPLAGIRASLAAVLLPFRDRARALGMSAFLFFGDFHIFSPY
jgi:hypothetical protein